MKVQNLKNLLPIIERLRREGRSIVFTNGCFDLIHAGHIHLLKTAKEKGDCLIVGLNTDDSVRRNKGDKRPILEEDQRGRILVAFESVDYVVFFDEDTPEEIIRKIKPDVLVKGGDYAMDEVLGREIVWENGGEVTLCRPREGRSTSQVIEDIISRFRR